MVLKLVSDKVVKKRKAPEPEPEPKKPGTMGVRVTEEEGNLVVSKIVEDGAAAEAGIQAGDKLLEVNGKKVQTLDNLADALQGLFAGDKVKLLIEREEETKTVELTLKEKR